MISFAGGEGERAFRSFVQAVRDVKEYHNIENLLVRKEGRIIENLLGPLITDLDTIPFPDRNLIPLNAGDSRLTGKSFRVVISRGCPNRCVYCCNPLWNELYRGSKICRNRSVANIMAELKLILARHDLDYFYFGEDNFTVMPLNIIKEFCERYKKEIGKPFATIFRAEFITEELVKLLKDAGLFLASIGVECADENIQKNFLKRGNITNADIIKAFGLFNKHKIKNYSLNLSILPIKDPLALDLETIKLNIRCKPTWAKFAILLPIPKTEIWKIAIENGYLKEDTFSRLKRLPSVLTATTLNLDSSLANRLNNLHKFSSIAVKFPILLPVIRVLIRFPQNRLYQYIDLFWYGYWNTIGMYNMKFSIKLLTRGIKIIRKYLIKH